MRTNVLALFILLFTFFSEAVSAQVTFQKSIHRTGSDFGSIVQQTTDDGYIIVGTTSFGSGSDDILLIKTDINGDTLWTKTYGGASEEYGQSVQQTADGGYIVSGNTKSFGAGDKDVYLIKTDASGNALWSRTFGGSGVEYGKSVQQTTDKGYIIGGTCFQAATGTNEMYLVKTDSNGHLLWTKIFASAGDDDGNFVRQTKDGGFILTGTTHGFGAGGNDIFVVKTKANGDTLWTRTFGSTGDDYGFSVKETRDDGYIFTGTQSSFGAGSYDSYLIRTNVNGQILWTKTFGGYDWDSGVSAEETSDSGFILHGQTYSFGVGSDVYLIKTNSSGDTLWTRIFGGNGYEHGGCVRQTKDGGYILTTGEESFGTNRDLYFIKTDANGNSSCHQANSLTIVASPTMPSTKIHTLVSSGGIENTPTTIIGGGATVITHCTTVSGIRPGGFQPELGAFPNPFTNELTITGTKENGEILILDLMGKEMLRVRSAEAIKMKTEQLQPGFYLLNYKENGQSVKTIKLIKF